MRIIDLQRAVAFLRRMSVGQMEADDLIQTVEQLEKEIEGRKKHERRSIRNEPRNSGVADESL